MQRKTRSLLEELENLAETRDVKHIIESRAHNIITSAIHLLEMINKNYDAERSAILERKLMIAIKNRDSSRFSRSLKKQNDEQPNEKEETAADNKNSTDE